MYSLRFLAVFLVLGGFPIGATAASCDKKQNLNMTLNCLLQVHPDLQVSKALTKASKAGIQKAAQRPNPKLNWELAQAKNVNGLNTEATFLHTLELGSKRKARIKLATSQSELQQIDYEKKYNQIKIEMILNLYRLRQIQHEVHTIKENALTFQKMISQYQKLKRLSPEQEVTISTFMMAKHEIQLKLQSLFNEKQKILAKFEYIQNKDFKLTNNLLPEKHENWPNLVSQKQFAGVQMQKSRLHLQASKMSLNLQEAQTWPNLAIGPKLIYSPYQQKKGVSLGATISLSLPLLNRNLGAQKQARFLYQKAELEESLLQREVRIEAKRLKKSYQSSVKSYKLALDSSDIHKNHKKVHSMIQRGVVSASLVIEMHRQVLEFYKSLHEQELQAVRMFWLYQSLFKNLRDIPVQRKVK